MVIPRIAGHNHAIDKQRFEYSPERARKLLAEARAAGVKVDSRRSPVPFNQWENTTETCESILAMSTAVGLKVTLRMLEVSLWVNHNTHPNKGPLTPEADAKFKGRGPVLLGHMHDNNVGDPVFSMMPKYRLQSADLVALHSRPGQENRCRNANACRSAAHEALGGDHGHSS